MRRIVMRMTGLYQAYKHVALPRREPTKSYYVNVTSLCIPSQPNRTIQPDLIAQLAEHRTFRARHNQSVHSHPHPPIFSVD